MKFCPHEKGGGGEKHLGVVLICEGGWGEGGYKTVGGSSEILPPSKGGGGGKKHLGVVLIWEL